MKRSAFQRKPRMKTCENPGCEVRFEKRSMTHRACSLECSVALTEADKRKAERQEDAKRREKLKTRSDYLKEAQTAFNRFVRERDRNRPCICCGKPLTLDAIGGGYDCGHYRSTGSAPHLRFDERNAHAQRKVCNRYGAGRAVDYRIGLVIRIGIEEVEALEADNTPRKWSKEDLIAIRDLYRRKLKDLQTKPLREAA
jgi:hypothetical protein